MRQDQIIQIAVSMARRANHARLRYKRKGLGTMEAYEAGKRDAAIILAWNVKGWDKSASVRNERPRKAA